eukprot:GHVU01058872.1.p1 GENE.GHVU01058872.1~~GHVU01058872.1.p1  ORF type:complete len:434 (+),score=35.87 GHVU01058872.1:152-1453(+)
MNAPHQSTSSNARVNNVTMEPQATPVPNPVPLFDSPPNANTPTAAVTSVKIQESYFQGNDGFGYPLTPETNFQSPPQFSYHALLCNSPAIIDASVFGWNAPPFAKNILHPSLASMSVSMFMLNTDDVSSDKECPVFPLPEIFMNELSHESLCLSLAHLDIPSLASTIHPNQPASNALPMMNTMLAQSPTVRRILFDSGATHDAISETMLQDLLVTTPSIEVIKLPSTFKVSLATKDAATYCNSYAFINVCLEVLPNTFVRLNRVAFMILQHEMPHAILGIPVLRALRIDPLQRLQEMCRQLPQLKPKAKTVHFEDSPAPKVDPVILSPASLHEMPSISTLHAHSVYEDVPESDMPFHFNKEKDDDDDIPDRHDLEPEFDPESSANINQLIRKQMDILIFRLRFLSNWMPSILNLLMCFVFDYYLMMALSNVEQ